MSIALLRSHSSVKFTMLFIVAVIIFLCYQFTGGSSPPETPIEPLHRNTSSHVVVDWTTAAKRVEEKKCVILFYSKFYRWDWQDPKKSYTGSFFSPSKDTSCTITSNHNYLPSIDDYDALIFFHWNVRSAEAFPPQETRRPEQVYILMLIESPQRSQNRSDIGPYSNYFNLTMSYRLDSDIMWPYGRIWDKKRKVQVAPESNPEWRVLPGETKFVPNKALIEKVAKKKKMISWVVSNCQDDPSQRMAMVRSLQKYVEVDVYGKCGKPCSNCKPKLADEYFFYLAFENSLAGDYVSEKPFEVIKTGLIPVVYGGADYDKFLPPNSYINAQKFKNTKELADFLIALSQNSEQYLSYFWWMDHYELKGTGYSDLCYKLNQFRRSNRVQYYSDLERWENENMWKNRTIEFS